MFADHMNQKRHVSEVQGHLYQRQLLIFLVSYPHGHGSLATCTLPVPGDLRGHCIVRLLSSSIVTIPQLHKLSHMHVSEKEGGRERERERERASLLLLT